MLPSVPPAKHCPVVVDGHEIPYSVAPRWLTPFSCHVAPPLPEVGLESRSRVAMQKVSMHPTSWRFPVVTDGRKLKVAPPLVVRRIVPLSPTRMQIEASMQVAPKRVLVVGDVLGVHMVLHMSYTHIWPPSPTAKHRRGVVSHPIP